uniref:NADH dehydrogenase subunit 3 n=1 Tax=Busonia albilateralis TaxID=2479888 RepID=UPI002410B9FF|nr:NADH dehydrogenase subunit 3 [Busonia albilateralis]WEP24816.1 NADH dehydrogenase subunit 3 [Busonia albilateralis]
MFFILLCTMIIMIMSLVIMILVIFISKKSIMDMQKMTPFECGFNPMSKKRLPFSIHFFIIAVIFLIFDVEIIIFMPLIKMINFIFLKYWLLSLLSFTLILILGLYHEWYNGILKWTK